MQKIKKRKKQKSVPVDDTLRQIKDSPTRSFLKALSWRMIASATTFLVTFIIFKNATDKTVDEVLQAAWYVTMVEFSSKILIYYLHERLWTNIWWGKYWQRSYWARRRWKRLYRKMHLS
jgi:adenylylsulfate kinase